MEENLRAPEVQAVRVGMLWNVEGDWRVVLIPGAEGGTQL